MKTLVAAAAAALTFAAPALADRPYGPYFGMSVGAESNEIGFVNVADANGEMAELFVGYDFDLTGADNLYAGVEANLGFSGARNAAGDTFERAVGVSFLLGFRAAEFVQVYGRVGGERLEFIGGGVRDNDTSGRYGIGTSISLPNFAHMRIEYSRSHREYSTIGTDVDNERVTVGFLKQF